MTNVLAKSVNKVTSKCDNLIDKVNYEKQLIRTVRDFKRYAEIYITDAGELTFIYDNLINMTVVIPMDPILMKIYAKRGEKTVMQDFMSAPEKEFTINGKRKNITFLTANIILRMINQEFKKRQQMQMHDFITKSCNKTKTR